MKRLTLIWLIGLLLFLVQCSANPTYPTIYRPVNSSTTTSTAEAREFAELYAKDQLNKTNETADVLNYLLNDEDLSDLNTALVLENTSNCNIIVRMVHVDGKRIYNLPVPKNSKNHFKIAKGNYTMKANVCHAKYYSQKSISESITLKISL